MNEIDITSPRGAIFSDDHKYRYVLWRVWHRRPELLFAIGLNPSVADTNHCDPTITRLCKRAQLLGFGGLLMGNLYSYVSTVPTILNADSVGTDTDYWLTVMAKMAKTHLACWGSFKAVSMRAPSVLEKLSNPVCLGVNADGQPKHPLYLSYSVPLIPLGGER